MKRLEQKWLSYFAAGELEKAGTVQQRETKRAFYAGALSAFNIMIDATKGGDPDAAPSDVELRTMEELHDELVEYNHALQDGRE